MSNTAQQFLKLQAMADAPEEERIRYFSLICQRAMLDAEIKLSQSQLQMQQLNATTTAAVVDNIVQLQLDDVAITNNNDVAKNDVDDNNSSGLEGIPPYQV